MMRVRVKKLTETATIPTYGSNMAACFDLYADCPNGDIVIEPHKSEFIHTGIAMQPISYTEEPKYVGKIYPRSGLGCKYGIRLCNSTGIIDEDYRGEIMVALHNDRDIPFTVHHKDRIAQMMWELMDRAILIESDYLTDTDRGNGGFGSTGV